MKAEQHQMSPKVFSKRLLLIQLVLRLMVISMAAQAGSALTHKGLRTSEASHSVQHSI
jgi:hypothetical protein